MFGIQSPLYLHLLLISIPLLLCFSYPPKELEGEVDRRVKRLDNDAIERRKEVAKRFNFKTPKPIASDASSSHNLGN